MYIMNYIDRGAVPQARIQGLEGDLGLQGVEYNVVLSITFVGYILMQVPSNMILTLVRPSWYLAACMIAWGVVSGASGAVHNFGGLAACRFFLGVTEVRQTMLCSHYFKLKLTQHTGSILCWMRVLVLRMVHTKGTRAPTGYFLLRRHAVGGLRWSIRCRNRRCL